MGVRVSRISFFPFKRDREPRSANHTPKQNMDEHRIQGFCIICDEMKCFGCCVGEAWKMFHDKERNVLMVRRPMCRFCGACIIFHPDDEKLILESAIWSCINDFKELKCSAMEFVPFGDYHNHRAHTITVNDRVDVSMMDF